MVQVVIGRADCLWTAFAGGAVLARSGEALELLEGERRLVIYFPRRDVAMDLLERSAERSICSLKGEASYFDLVTPAGRIENIAWSYETPKQPMGAIAGHLGFYPDRVTLKRTPL